MRCNALQPPNAMRWSGIIAAFVHKLRSSPLFQAHDMHSHSVAATVFGSLACSLAYAALWIERSIHRFVNRAFALELSPDGVHRRANRSMHACMHAYIHTYIHACMHEMPAGRQTDKTQTNEPQPRPGLGLCPSSSASSSSSVLKPHLYVARRQSKLSWSEGDVCFVSQGAEAGIPWHKESTKSPQSRPSKQEQARARKPPRPPRRYRFASRRGGNSGSVSRPRPPPSSAATTELRLAPSTGRTRGGLKIACLGLFVGLLACLPGWLLACGALACGYREIRPTEIFTASVSLLASLRFVVQG